MPTPLRAIVVTLGVTHITSVTKIPGLKKMLELKPKSNGTGPQQQESKQSVRLVLALGLLVVALIAVVARDHQFWLGGDDTILDADTNTPQATSQPAAATSSTRPTKSTPVAKKSIKAVKYSVATNSADSSNDANAGAVTTTRTMLPPLDVEVIAGDKHSTVRPGSNSTHVELTKPGSTGTFTAPTTSAAEREPMSTGTAASYPLLAQHMNVEGSVVLQALISAEGTIQNLHVVSGPAILAAAAQQAVREWKFKPVVQNGQPVETQAKITVNFAIKVADGSKDEIATAMPLRYSYSWSGGSR
jgi:TonB family protein